MENTTATAEQHEYLTVAEVSSRFRVSVPTIYRRCADGTLPHIRIGSDGPIRIPTSQLERLYDQGVPDDGSPAEGSFAGSRRTTARPLKLGPERTRSGVSARHPSGSGVTN